MIFSIIVPVFNEEKTIISILKELKKINFKKFEKEIIVIDDGSTDNTKNLLENNKDLFDSLHTNEKNKGKGSAVRLGLKNAKWPVYCLSRCRFRI